MSLRKAAYDLCGPPERNLNVILFKQCSLLQLLMCSSLIQGKSSRRCIVAVVIETGDSPSCVSLALLCFWPLDALLLEDWDIIARSLFLGDKANVRPEGGVCSDSSSPQPPKLDFYILIMTCYSEPSVFSNWGDLSERVRDGRHLRYLLCGCVFVFLQEGGDWVAEGKIVFAFPWLCQREQGLWGAAHPLWSLKEAFSEGPLGSGHFQGWRKKLLCKDARVCMYGAVYSSLEFHSLGQWIWVQTTRNFFFFLIIDNFKEGFKD